MRYFINCELDMNFDCDKDYIDCMIEDIPIGISAAVYDLTGATINKCIVNNITKERIHKMISQSITLTIDDPTVLTRMNTINERMKKINKNWHETRLNQTITELLPQSLNMILLMLETHINELESK